MPSEALIAVDKVNHFYGRGSLRKQILFDVCVQIRRGEIVILKGPSGSGKTTLLSLIGALRATQEGSVNVLGQELNGAAERSLRTAIAAATEHIRIVRPSTATQVCTVITIGRCVAAAAVP